MLLHRVHRSSSGRDSDRHHSSTRDSDRSSHRSRDRERSHKDSRDRHRSRSRDRWLSEIDCYCSTYRCSVLFTVQYIHVWLLTMHSCLCTGVDTLLNMMNSAALHCKRLLKPSLLMAPCYNPADMVLSNLRNIHINRPLWGGWQWLTPCIGKYATYRHDLLNSRHHRSYELQKEHQVPASSI